MPKIVSDYEQQFSPRTLRIVRVPQFELYLPTRWRGARGFFARVGERGGFPDTPICWQAMSRIPRVVDGFSPDQFCVSCLNQWPRYRVKHLHDDPALDDSPSATDKPGQAGRLTNRKPSLSPMKFLTTSTIREDIRNSSDGPIRVCMASYEGSQGI